MVARLKYIRIYIGKTRRRAKIARGRILAHPTVRPPTKKMAQTSHPEHDAEIIQKEADYFNMIFIWKYPKATRGSAKNGGNYVLRK